MKIAIAEKLRPYSHTPGMRAILPGTHCIVQAYPALLQVGPYDIPLQGPVHRFTMQQDLEKNCIWVFCQEYQIQIRATEEGFELKREKEVSFFPNKHAFYLPQKWERLSLGMHKSQDWDLIWRRFDLKEILPILFGLGQKIPPLPLQASFSTAYPLDAFCKAAFHHILVPRLHDDQHQGFFSDFTGHPFSLLQEAAFLIRSLFFQEDGNLLHLLPNCPFDAGRLINIQTSFGSLDLEWRKKVPRRAILRAAAMGEVFLRLPPDIKRFRVGRETQDAESPLCLEEGRVYFLDRFQRIF